MDSNKDQENKRQNIKKSLEQQQQLNKQKFQDPFFIQIGGDSGDSTSNLKIVKQKRKGEDDTDNENGHGDAYESGQSDIELRNRADKNKTVNIGGVRKSSVSLRRPTNTTVVEVREEEESSPKLRAYQRNSPTRNEQDKTKALSKKAKHDSGLMSEAENYEKISDDARSTVKTLPQLVKLDINLDTLKNFLEDIQEAINDHAKTIGVIQGDMKKKANEKTISHYFLKISEGLHKECGERPHAFRLDNEQQNFLSDNFQTDDSVILKRHSEKLQEKLEIIGLNLINLTKFRGHTEDRLERLERIIPKCFTVDQFREESQQQETRTMKYINDQLGTFQENLNGYKKELNEALTHFDKKVNDNQSATLWRIKDCEELLKSRVSDKYVNDAVKSVEEKVTKQLNYSDEKQVERLEKSFKELGVRIVQTNQFFQEKFDDLRKVISMYDSKILNMATNDKLASVQTGYRDMKYNFEREMEMLQEHVKETKDKIGELNKRFSNLEIATTVLANGGEFNYQMLGNHQMPHPNQHNSNQGTSRNQFQQQANSDKQQKSQQNIKGSPSVKDKGDHSNPSNMSNSSPGASGFSPIARKRQNRAADAAYAAEMEKRIQQFEQQFDNIDTKFENLKKQMDEKITKEDVRKLTSDKISKEDLEHIIPNEDITVEKLKYVVREEIDQLQLKLGEQFKQYDNKMIRLRAEIDIHSIQRQLERKANEDQVRSDFGNHEFKIGTLDRNIIRMATDFETFQIALNKIHSAIVELQDANRDVLLGKKTTNCLSCGKGGDTVQTVKGKDGRMYKAADHGQVKLHQDDSALIGNHYNFYDSQSPQTLLPNSNNHHQMSIGQNNYDNNNQEFFKIRQSNSFYDSGLGGAYDNNQSLNHQNLPSVHKKKNSIGNGSSALIKGMASHAGLNTSAVIGQSQASLNLNNSSLQQTKKKLPFGFQVQQEKKELFKVGQRGKSSQNMKRATSNRAYEMRPDSAKNRDTNAFNFNSTYEQN